MDNVVVKLNVGGQIYLTSQATLTKHSMSMLATMFSDCQAGSLIKDKSGTVFIDRDGHLFGHILEWLRTGHVERIIHVLTDTTHNGFPVVEELVEADVKSLLSAEDKEKYIDLKPFINNTPYTAYDTSYYPKIFALFRALGLRHLVIVNRNNEVVGIITRKDIACYREHTSRGSVTMTLLDIL